MPEDDWPVRGWIDFPEDEVGVADPGAGNPDEDLSPA
jgi:hypothetical protein